MAHAPSQVRALIQEAKQGGRPMALLLRDARAIEEPSHAADALFALSEFVPDAQAGDVLGEVAGLVGKIERGWRKAEVIAGLAKRGPTWRNGDDHLNDALGRFQRTLLRLAMDLEGQDLSSALPMVARWCPEELMPDLFKRALAAGSDPLEDGKQILSLGEAEGLIEAVRALPDPALRARLLAYHHLHNPQPLLEEALAVAATLAPKEQVEVVRGIVASLPASELATVHAQLPADAEAKARLLSAIAARADKEGRADWAAAWFAEGKEAASAIADAKARESVLANLAKGADRLRSGAPAAPATPAPAKPKPAAAPAAPPAGKRPILALVDTYDGKLGETHLRAIGRAAPLCWAFGLDLALVGFPGGLDQAVRKASKETNIGEGEGYVAELAAAGRIHWLPAPAEGLPAFPGLPIATTPSPDAARAVDFAAAQAAAGSRPLVVLMGLGKRGLPPSWLKAIPHHLELTGSRVSLETATAMGILAERMRLLALQEK